MLSTPPRIARETVCPNAPARSSTNLSTTNLSMTNLSTTNLSSSTLSSTNYYRKAYDIMAEEFTTAVITKYPPQESFMLYQFSHIYGENDTSQKTLKPFHDAIENWRLTNKLHIDGITMQDADIKTVVNVIMQKLLAASDTFFGRNTPVVLCPDFEEPPVVPRRLSFRAL